MTGKRGEVLQTIPRREGQNGQPGVLVRLDPFLAERWREPIEITGLEVIYDPQDLADEE